MTESSRYSTSRRNFIKYTSLGVASMGSVGSLVGSLLPNSAFAAEQGAQDILTAAHWGPIKVTVKDNKVLKSGPYYPTSFSNPLQTVTHDLVHSKSRIKYPMVRKSYLDNPGKSDTSARGSDEWVRVSWDKAIELVTAELKRVRSERGATGIFAGSYGWKSAGNLHNCRTLLHRFMSMTGGFVGHKGDYSTAASQIIMPHVMGTIEVYEQQTSWPVVLESSDIVVIWHANPMVTLQIAWASSDETGLEYFKKLKESGKRIICIDPLRTESCDYLGAEWISPVPGTDVALMLGIAHTLVSEKKHDQAFLDKYTVGFDKFLPYLTGETDKQAKDAEWASKVCGIPAEVIRKLALDFAANRTMFMAGWGSQRHHYGEQVHWMLATLCSMLGQIGLPGGGFGLSYHYSNGGNPDCSGGIVGGMTIGEEDGGQAEWLVDASAASFPLARISDVLLNPGKKFQFNGHELTSPDIGLIYWVGGNPWVHHQDLNTFIKAWQKPETIIVHDMYWTPTARMADIVLPITTPYERNDITMSGDYANQHILPMKQCVDPQFESRSDYDIFSELAKNFGIAEKYTEGRGEMDWIREFYDQAFKQARDNKVRMPRFEDFWNKNVPVEFKATASAKKWVRYGDFREDPLLNPLGTPSGKIEIFSKTIEKMGYDDCPPHPTWLEPIEWLGMDNKPAPVHLLSGHPKYRLHSQLSNTSLRKEYAVADREPILINPEDAKERGIADGDIVRVFNKRGQILAGAVITDAAPKGVARIFEGAWYDPLEPGKPGTLCKNGSVNVLTIDIGTSQLAQGNIAHTTLVDFEKFSGEVPPLTVFTPPKGA